MTIRLYDADSSLLTFTARVVSCREKEKGCIVVLDRTAFFPEGGGQGADHGTLGGVNVLDVHEAGGEVEHLTDTPLVPGDTVEGCVDAQRRLSMMQQHSGEHIFSGLVCRLYGYDNVGFHIGSDAVTMDFNGPLTMEQALEIERMANEIVWKNIPVRTLLPTPQELEAMTYRSKKALSGEVRIVQIEGADICACCGTHVKQTGSIGQIKLLGVQKYKSGVRVSILCGMRALAYENMELEQMRRITGSLSVRQHEAADAVERLIAERDNLRWKSEQLGMKIFEQLAAQQKDETIRIVACDVLSPGAAGKAAAGLSEGARMGLVLIAREGGWNFALSSQTEDVRPVTRALCQRFGGKGGGPKDIAQGILESCTEQEIRELLAGL